MCACLLVAILLPVTSVQAEAAGYDANAAVAYAAAHWDDGVGVCDQFIKACLQAGGIDIQAGGVEPVRSALIDAGYGSAVELSQDKGSPYISWSKNSAKLSVGDILFFYCSASDCQKNVHIAIVAGYDADDHLLAYAHNPAWNRTSVVRVFHQGHTERWTASAVHIKGGQWSHTHQFTTQAYDEEHPHAMYMACSCGAKYYLGWNAKVSSCPYCNPGYGVQSTVPGSYDVTIPAHTEVKYYAAADGWVSDGTLPAQGSAYVRPCTEKVIMTDGKLRFGFRDSSGAMRYFIYTEGMSYITHRPAAPKAAVSTIASTGKVQLKWNAVKNAAKYQVYYSTNADFSGAKVFTTTKTSMKHTGAVTGTTYYYKVCAVDANGTVSAFSPAVSRTCAPAAPKATGSNVTSTGKIRLTWKAVNGATKYEVYRSTSKNGPYTRMFTTTKTTMTHAGAAVGTTYYYKVRALTANGTASAFSNIVSRTCATVPPQAQGSILSTGKIQLTWGSVSGAAKYQVYYSTNADFSGAKVFTTTKTSMNHTGAVAGTTYYYKVRAVTSNGKASAFSSVLQLTCAPSAPQISGTGYNSAGKPKITWSAVKGADRYEVYVSTSENGTYRKLTTTAKCSVIHTGAVSGRTYYYKLRAVNQSVGTVSAFSKAVCIRAK